MSYLKKLIDNGVSVDDIMEMSKLYDKARAEVIGNKFKKLVSLQFELETLGKPETILKRQIVDLKEKLKLKTAEEHNNLYMFFTINPNKTVKLNDFMKKVDKAVRKTCFVDYLYVVEQRGTNSATAGTGFHAHILVKRNLDYKPFKCKKNMQNTFSKMCNVNNDNIFNVKYCNTEWAGDKVKYMTYGGKTGEGKDIKQDIDRWWREKNKIPKFFGNEKISET